MGDGERAHEHAGFEQRGGIRHGFQQLSQGDVGALLGDFALQDGNFPPILRNACGAFGQQLAHVGGSEPEQGGILCGVAVNSVLVRAGSELVEYGHAVGSGAEPAAGQIYPQRCFQLLRLYGFIAQLLCEGIGSGVTGFLCHLVPEGELAPAGALIQQAAPVGTVLRQILYRASDEAGNLLLQSRVGIIEPLPGIQLWAERVLQGAGGEQLLHERQRQGTVRGVPRQPAGVGQFLCGGGSSPVQHLYFRGGVAEDIGSGSLHGQESFKIVAAVRFIWAECQYLQVFASLAYSEETEDEVGELRFLPAGVAEFQLRIIRGTLRVGEGKPGGLLAIVCGGGYDFFHPCQRGRGMGRAEAAVVGASATAQAAEQTAERVSALRWQICGFRAEGGSQLAVDNGGLSAQVNHLLQRLRHFFLPFKGIGCSADGGGRSAQHICHGAVVQCQLLSQSAELFPAGGCHFQRGIRGGGEGGGIALLGQQADVIIQAASIALRAVQLVGQEVERVSQRGHGVHRVAPVRVGHGTGGGINGGAELGNGIFLVGLGGMQLQTEFGEPDALESAMYYGEGGGFFCHEEDGFAMPQTVGYHVGDGLALAGTWRPDEDKALPPSGGQHGRKLRGVR